MSDDVITGPAFAGGCCRAPCVWWSPDSPCTDDCAIRDQDEEGDTHACAKHWREYGDSR